MSLETLRRIPGEDTARHDNRKRKDPMTWEKTYGRKTAQADGREA